MSLILEALRKSEEQRRLGETPTLASVPAWTRKRQRRFWRPSTVAALVVAAVVAGWWYGDRGAVEEEPAPSREARRGAASTARTAPPAPPQGTSFRPSAAETRQAAVAAVAAGATTTDGVARPGRQAAQPPQDFANSPDLRTPAAPTQQTPYVPPEAALPAPLPDPENTVVDPGLVAVPPQPQAATPPAAARVAAAPPSPPQAVAPTVVPAPAVPAPPLATTTAAVPQGAAAVPLIFELSLATRQALPPLKLNMHVYNDNPAGRFVIVDGTRAAESEALAENLKVVAIRPDGVVIAFRGEEFLLPRSGR